MNYEDKTKEQLVNELIELHQRITNLRISEELHERFKDALATSERRFRELAVLLPVTVFEIDLNAKLTFVNRVAFDIFGYSQEDFDRGINAFQVIAQEDHERLKESISRLYNGEDIGIIEFTAQKKDGSRFPVIVHSNVIKNEGGPPIGYRGILIDITERKRAEDAFKASEERYRGLYDSSRDGIFSVDMNGRIVECNQAMADILGYTKKELYNFTVYDIVPQKWHDFGNKIITEQVFRRGYSDEYELEAIKKDGSSLPVSIRTWIIKDKDGKPVGRWSIARDITERKQAEEALKESEKRYRGLYKSSRDGIISVDMDGNIIECNQSLADMLDYTKEELYRSKFQDLMSNKWLAKTAQILNEQIIPRGFSDVNEMEAIKKDGTIIPISVRTWLIKDRDGNLTGTWAIIRDISKRKRVEEAFKESEKRYRSLFEDSRDAIYFTTREGKLINVNQALIELFGFSREELQKINVRELYIDPTDRSVFQREIEQKGSVRNYELKLRKKENTEIDCLLTATVRRDNDGKIIGYQGIIRDITERKKLERQLVESEEKYRTLVEKDPNMIYLIKDGELTFANQALLNTLGYSLKEILDISLDDLSPIVPEQRLMIKERLKKRIAGKNVLESYEFSVMTKNGEIIPCLLNTTSFELEGTRIIQGVLTDIRKVKKLEKELKESEERYRGLYNSTIDGIVSQDIEGNILDCNQAFIDMHGYTKEEIYQLKLKELIPSKWNKIIERMINEQLIPYGYSDEFELECIKKDGTIFPVSARSWLTKNKEGKPLEVWSIIRDITERKRAEEALIESEERYRGLYESSIDGIVSADGGNIIECNQAFANMLGYTKEEIKKMNYMDLVPSKWHNELTKVLIEPRQKKGYSDEHKLEIAKKDGSLIPISIRAWLMKDKEGFASKGWAIIRDISEKRKMEEELHKIEKLESLGILAGGIAHDFNNILTGILGNITLAKMYAPFREKVLERLSEAEKATIRARDLTQQLLTFSKGGAPVKKTASIDELLRDTTVFTLSGSNVKCKFSIPEDIWSVEIDEGQISQVLNNLIINADQAMPDGGIINISAENVIIGTKDILPLQEGRYIKLSIKDQGIGIPEEYLQKIFDPYFTTKQKGSGLGLTIAYSIIKNHKGHIVVESKLGAGSNFSIYLPALKTQVPKEKEAENRPITGKGKIMVMDDEEVIRDSLGEILTFLGYEVGFARDGEEAITIYKKAKDTGQSFDAVILDLTIRGGMGGKETIGKLIEIDPKVKAIVSSGYSTDPVMADFKNYGFSGVVAKPYDIKELNEALDSVINGI